MGGSFYIDLGRLSLILRVALAISIALAAASLWSGWLQIDLLQRHLAGAVISEAEAAANDGRQQAVALLGLGLYVVTAVIFLRWIYLANRNARALGAVDMEFSPGWSVGWYFVPVANLWKPYQAMKEIFKASHPHYTADWRSAPPPGILALWWGLWLVAGFAGQAILRASLRAETPEAFLTSSQMTMFSDVIDVLLGIVAIVLVGILQGWQIDKSRRLAAAYAQAPQIGRPGAPSPFTGAFEAVPLSADFEDPNSPS